MTNDTCSGRHDRITYITNVEGEFSRCGHCGKIFEPTKLAEQMTAEDIEEHQAMLATVGYVWMIAFFLSSITAVLAVAVQQPWVMTSVIVYVSWALIRTNRVMYPERKEQ